MVSSSSPQKVGRQIQRYLNWTLKTRWARRFMRAGYGAKGILYGLIGLFALVNAVTNTSSDSTAGSEGVLIALADRAIGNVLLGLIGTGLLGYVLWRLVQACLDPENAKETSFLRMMQRCGYATSGFTYLGIAYTAGKLAIGLTVEHDDTLEDIASVLFEQDVGPWLFLMIGLGVVGVGLTYLYGAASGSYISDFRSELPQVIKRAARFIGRIGIAARGAGFILIGLHLLRSAYLVEDDPAGGLGKVLVQLDRQPGGDGWLLAIAFGFIAYAIYMIVAAVYRRFPKALP
ncbi:MAG: DUF1206 domain-containing protein [Cyanobacteria bacterium J06638_28]